MWDPINARIHMSMSMFSQSQDDVANFALSLMLSAVISASHCNDKINAHPTRSPKTDGTFQRHISCCAFAAGCGPNEWALIRREATVPDVKSQSWNKTRTRNGVHKRLQ
jgi:hypothetical protein